MKKLYILFSVVGTLSFYSSFGQYYEPDSVKTPNTVVRVHLLPPGALVEQAIGQNATIVLDFQLGLAYTYQEVNGVAESAFYTFPTLMAQPRFYTTQEKRKRLGRRTDYFSGGYVGIPLVYTFETKSFGSTFTLGGMYGFQRTLGQKGYWNIAGGLGFTNGIPRLLSDFGIGFILN